MNIWKQVYKLIIVFEGSWRIEKNYVFTNQNDYRNNPKEIFEIAKKELVETLGIAISNEEYSCENLVWIAEESNPIYLTAKWLYDNIHIENEIGYTDYELALKESEVSARDVKYDDFLECVEKVELLASLE
ncbi:hypothetical protein [Priestia aryabhattai]